MRIPLVRGLLALCVLALLLGLPVLLWPGGAFRESPDGGGVIGVPNWKEELDLPAAALPGARLFAQSGCLNCHAFLGLGGGFRGAVDLTAEGKRGRGIGWQIAHLRCPRCLVPQSRMPKYQVLGADNLRKLAIFVEASRGRSR